MSEPGTARQQVGEPRQDGNVAAVNRFSGRCIPPGTFEWIEWLVVWLNTQPPGLSVHSVQPI